VVPEGQGQAGPQAAAWLLAAALKYGLGRLQLRQRTQAMLVIRLPVFGQALPAGGALQQTSAKPRLQSRQALAHR
jgi:hypothetical protein